MWPSVLCRNFDIYLGGKQKTRSFSGESSPAAKKARLEKAGPSGGRSKCTGSGATVEDSQPLGLLLTKVHGIDEAHNRRLAVNLRGNSFIY